MPRKHYGPEAKKQTKRVLEALLAYANYKLENCDSEAASQKHRLQIKFDWKTDNELVVELIRIKAPRQMGKTSLLNRIVAHAAQQDYQTVRLNLLQAEGAVFSSLNKFLRWFCACVSQELELPSQLSEYWDEDRGSIVNCTTYFEAHLLEQIGSPIVLALDEVDRVFQSTEIAQGFFPMLRSWHEEAKT
jgi:hypothetical protein